PAAVVQVEVPVLAQEVHVLPTDAGACLPAVHLTAGVHTHLRVWPAQGAQIGAEVAGPLLGAGAQQFGGAVHAGEYVQAGEPGGAGAGEVGVQPVPDHQGMLRAGPVARLFEDACLGFSGRAWRDSGGVYDAGNEVSVAQGGAAFGGDGGIEVGGDVLRAGLDGVGRFGQVRPGERFVEALDDDVGAFVRAVHQHQLAFLEGHVQPGAADGQDACSWADRVQHELRGCLCGGDDPFGASADTQFVELVGD